MTEQEYLQWLRAQITYDVTAKSLAKAWGVSDSTLCLVLAGKRKPGPKLLKATGFEVRYIQK